MIKCLKGHKLIYVPKSPFLTEESSGCREWGSYYKTKYPVHNFHLSNSVGKSNHSMSNAFPPLFLLVKTAAFKYPCRKIGAKERQI